MRYCHYFASVVGVHWLLTFQLISHKSLAKLEKNLVEMLHGWSSALYLIFAAFGYSIWLLRPFILLLWLAKILKKMSETTYVIELLIGRNVPENDHNISRTASVTGELQSQVPVTWLSLHFWWKMTFNPSLKILRFTINIYAWNQLKYTEDVYG